MRKVMKFLWVVQETQRVPKLGIHPRKFYRLNPWNPLTYLTIMVTLFIGLVLFGLVGFWKEVDSKNPFSWR